MKLPTIQRFQKQNYSGSPDWFTRFLSDLNSFTETVWNILNNNVTPADNMDSQIFVQTLLAGAAASDNSFQFETTMDKVPQAVLVASVVDTEAYQAALANAVGVQWTVSGKTISVTGVTGLTAGQTYQLTLLIF